MSLDTDLGCLAKMLSILEHHAQRVIASVYSKVIFPPLPLGTDPD
jgi:hypothetical protein